MLYCCQCGNGVETADKFCGKCGARQPEQKKEFLSGINARTASVICYVPMVGWIASIIVLASSRFRADRLTRFHAFQGLYLFVAWLIVDMVLGPMLQFWTFPAIGGKIYEKLLKLGVIAVSIFMIIRTSQDQPYRLPLLGDLADKSVSEQH